MSERVHHMPCAVSGLPTSSIRRHREQLFRWCFGGKYEAMMLAAGLQPGLRHLGVNIVPTVAGRSQARRWVPPPARRRDPETRSRPHVVTLGGVGGGPTKGGQHVSDVGLSAIRNARCGRWVRLLDDHRGPGQTSGGTRSR